MLLTTHVIYIIESYEFLLNIEIFLSMYNVLNSKENFKKVSITIAFVK